MSGLLRLAILGALAVLAAGFLGALHPGLDLVAHFRVAVAVGTLGLAIAALALPGARQAGVVAGSAALVALASVSPHLGGGGAAADAAPDAVVLSMNLRYDARPGPAFDLIAAIDPDLILLQEVSPQWRQALGGLPTHRHRAFCDIPPDAVGGPAILSRHPLTGGGCNAVARIVAREVTLSGHHMSVASQHLPWPYPFGQNASLAAAAPYIAALPRPLLLAGDFNATPWSRAAATIGAAVGAQPQAVGGTWPTTRLAGAPLAVLGLPLDYAFADGLSATLSRLDPTASDHLPIRIELRHADRTAQREGGPW